MGAAITATTISQVAKIQNFDVANITARMNFVAWGTLGATTYWSIKTLTNVPSVMRLIRSMPGYSTVFVFTQTRFSNLMLSVVGCGLIAGGVWGTNKLMESRFEKALPLTPPGVEGTAPNPDAPKANWDSPFPKCLEQGMVLTQLICSLALIKLSNSSRFFAGLATLQAIGYLALANWKWIAVKMNTGSIAFADAEDPTITTTVFLYLSIQLHQLPLS